MGRAAVETIMGAVVLLIAGFFVVFAYSAADLSDVQGHHYKASFGSLGALRPGNDVRIGGVKVGTVLRQRINPKNFRAEITFTVRKEIRMPADTEASVTSEGLIGGKYLRLVVGTSKKRLAPGGTISKTRDALSVEELLSRAIFLLTEDPKKARKDGQK
jgi:phospholipid/cholesterol/gamma-HCH transport system substrate-binding protein